MKIAILYICIGEYVKFWEEFYCSFENKFLKEDEKEYFVFTDSPTIYDEVQNKNIHRIYQEDLGWPGNTLFRFEMFLKVEEQLKCFDYIFFMNANIVCKKEITREMFLPLDHGLLVVQHPGYYDKEGYEFPCERNRKSNAYVPYGREGQAYVCGGVNGGKAEAYLTLIRELAKYIHEDLERGIIAKWHDESHLNKYIILNTDYRMLSPAFCYSEGKNIPFEENFLVRDKSKVIKLDSNKIKQQKGKKFAGIKRKLIGVIIKCRKKYER